MKTEKDEKENHKGIKKENQNKVQFLGKKTETRYLWKKFLSTKICFFIFFCSLFYG